MLSFDRTLAYLFLAVAMLGSLELCLQPLLESELWWSAVCFLSAIPVLTLAVVMGLADDESIGGSLVATVTYNVVKVAGLIITLTGFGFLFYYRSAPLGIAFFASVGVAMIVYRIWWSTLRP